MSIIERKKIKFIKIREAFSSQREELDANRLQIEHIKANLSSGFFEEISDYFKIDLSIVTDFFKNFVIKIILWMLGFIIFLNLRFSSR